MIAMTRIPRVRLVLVVAALMALLVVPMVGAKTLSSPSLHAADGGWLGATLRWVEDAVALNSHGHAVSKAPRHQKEAQNGNCQDPTGGKPKPPICF
jgi:hypothetical protein